MKAIPSGYKRIESSRRAPRPGAKMVGPADPNETLTVSVRVRRRPDAPALPDPASLAAAPVGERPLLSREDFAEHYGAAQSDLDKVADFGKFRAVPWSSPARSRR
jgi:kumamolisin